MRGRALLVQVALGSPFLAFVACGKPPGDGPPPLPDQLTDFATLYGTSCAGCHGADGTHGPARPLNDPVYLAVIDDDALHRIVADGIEGTLMPGFSRRAGGLLTDAQVGFVVEGLKSTWGDGAGAPAGAPPYAAPPGHAGSGEAVFAAACAGCHGADGAGGTGARAAGSVVDPSFLALTSDQGLRSAVLFGRVDLGVPDWRTVGSDGPLTGREVADVVAWLAAQRVEFPGQLDRTNHSEATERSDGR